MTGKRLCRILITAAVGFLIAVWAANMRGYTRYASVPLKLRYASDGCFTAAVILAGTGFLTVIASSGFFDIFSYGIQSLWSHISSIWRGYEHVRYYDYKAMRAERRKRSPLYILAVGLCFLAASVILLILYYTMT